MLYEKYMIEHIQDTIRYTRHDQTYIRHDMIELINYYYIQLFQNRNLIIFTCKK